jgi:hypothetical protein
VTVLERLGEFYRTAPEVFRDPTRAVWYLRRASNAGSASAAITLANMLLSGDGVRPDKAGAVALLNATAARGSVKAREQLAALAGSGEQQNAKADSESQNQEESANPPPSIPADPPSELAGRKLTLEELLPIAYQAGFRTKDKLLAAVAVAVAESGLWTASRNWKPELGYRPATDKILVPGPPGAWTADQRQQMHADRGLWQISSYWWPSVNDTTTDDPRRAAARVLLVSRGGVDFSSWSSYSSGRAQKHFDQAVDGWPPLRQLVEQFLREYGTGAVQPATSEDDG